MKAPLNVTACLMASSLMMGALHAQVAISATPSVPDLPKHVQEAPSTTPAEPATFVSDGTPYTDHEIGLTITPPAGWEIQKKSLGMSLIMEEPKQDTTKLKAGETIYQRNITVLTLRGGMPIDEKEASVLKEKLAKDFGGAPGVQDFRVLDEHKFFDFKGKNDGLIIYTTFNSQGTPMAQMHVAVSGAEKGFLMTYTDVASQFEKNEAAFSAAWKTMASAEVMGEAPVRYAEYKRYGLIGVGFLMAMSVLLFMRRKNAKYRLEAEAEGENEGEKDGAEKDNVAGDDDVVVHVGEGSHVSRIVAKKQREKRADKLATISALAPLSDMQSFHDLDFSDSEPLSNVSSLR